MNILSNIRMMEHFGYAVPPAIRKLADAEHPLQGHTSVQGIPIAIENRKGSVRSGVDKDGKPWRTVMKHPYGYIKGTRGADGEEVDVYVGPRRDAPYVFVVHQHKVTGKGYDEDKVMLGFKDEQAARAGYLKHYDNPKFLGRISKLTVERLKELIAKKKKLVKISEMLPGFLDELADIYDARSAP